MHCKPISVNTKCQSQFKKKCMYVMHTHTHRHSKRIFICEKLSGKFSYHHRLSRLVVALFNT